MSKKIIWFIFAVLAIVLLPVTGLWALFAYLAGDKYPLYALRGENVDDDLIDNPIKGNEGRMPFKKGGYTP